MLRLKFSLLMSWRHFLIKKSKEGNWPSRGSPLRFSSLKRLENVFVRGVRIIRSLSWKKAISWTRRRNFSTSCLTENSSSFLDIGTKLNPLLRTAYIVEGIFTQLSDERKEIRSVERAFSWCIKLTSFPGAGKGEILGTRLASTLKSHSGQAQINPLAKRNQKFLVLNSSGPYWSLDLPRLSLVSR